MNKVVAVVLIFLIVISLLGIGVSVLFYTQRETVDDYAIVFDAGSSGSRMYIYKWNADYKPNSNMELKIEQVTSCITEDNGIDKIKSEDELRSKFGRCVSRADEIVPADRKNRTRISLVATAGMRLMEANGKSSANTFDIIRSYFKTTGFLFTNDSQVKVITGNDEALFGWITANFLEKNFHTNQETKGLIDLGGASTQLIFVPRNQDSSTSKRIKLFGKDFITYSQSFLCYGLNEANLMYRSNIVKKNKYQTQSASLASCFPQGSNITLPSDQFAKSPCANGRIFDDMVPDENLQKSYRFYGESDYEKCAADIKELFVDRKSCKTGTDACSFKEQFIASTDNSMFLAVSSFWYAMSETSRLLKRKLDGDLEGFIKATKELCALDISQINQLNQESKAGLDPRRMPQICFQNTYAIELLERYGFKDIKNVKIVDTVNGFSVGWTLGYFINELNEQVIPPEDTPPRRIPLIGFIIIVSLLALLALGAIVALIYIGIKRNEF